MMCHRSQPLNGADAIPPGPAVEPDAAAVLAAYHRCTAAIARRDVAAVVYELRAFADYPEAHELLVAMLEADPEPDDEPRGQALVEFALVLPLLLLLVIGAIWFSLLMLQTSRMDHAAREGAVAGATAEEGIDRCDRAIEASTAVLEAPGVSRECVIDGELVTVTLSGSLPVPPPLDALHDGDIEVDASAIIRPTPSEAPTP